MAGENENWWLKALEQGDRWGGSALELVFLGRVWKPGFQPKRRKRQNHGAKVVRVCTLCAHVSRCDPCLAAVGLVRPGPRIQRQIYREDPGSRVEWDDRPGRDPRHFVGCALLP